MLGLYLGVYAIYVYVLIFIYIKKKQEKEKKPFKKIFLIFFAGGRW